VAAEGAALLLRVSVCQLHGLHDGPVEHTQGGRGSTYVVPSGLWPTGHCLEEMPVAFRERPVAQITVTTGFLNCNFFIRKGPMEF